MQPYIRKYSYIQDYYYTLYQIYSTNYIGYPVNYYMFDPDESVFDKDQLISGSYEKNGIGDLSGIKFRKILLLPVYGVEQIQPSYNASEKGLNLSDSEYSSLSFSSEFGIVPNEWDVIHFNQSFMFPDKPFDLDPLFTVTNINKATYGSVTHYQTKVRVASFNREDIEKQISSYWMFLDFTKKIHRIDTAALLLRLQKRSTDIYSNLQDMFHNTGFYLQGNGG